MLYTYKQRGTLTRTAIKNKVNHFVITLTAALLIGGLAIAACLTTLCIINQANKHAEYMKRLDNQRELNKEMIAANKEIIMHENDLIAGLERGKQSQKGQETKWIVIAVIAIAAILLFKKGSK